MISFKANLVNSINIKQLDKNGCYKDLPANFVELDINSELDLKTLSKVNENWKQGDNFAKLIYNSFYHYHNIRKKSKKGKFYALTSQQGDFKELDENKILGITQIYKNNRKSIEIESLQTNPKYIYGVKNRKIKHIGEAIIQSLKENFNNCDILLFSTKAGKPLYEKMGFKTIKGFMMILKR